jgi:hypothetical protein
MEVEAMEEGEINDKAGEEVVMEDMDYAEICQTKEEAGETGPESSLEEELMAKF